MKRLIVQIHNTRHETRWIGLFVDNRVDRGEKDRYRPRDKMTDGLMK